MTESDALCRLLAWLSPSYPIGAFSYSHGLETANEDGLVGDVPSLHGWLCDIVGHGAGRNDGLFLKAAYDACMDKDATALARIADLALAFQSTSEPVLETAAQGQAFLDTTLDAWPVASLTRLRQAQQGRAARRRRGGGCRPSHRA